jgi:hypothetical protein
MNRTLILALSAALGAGFVSGCASLRSAVGENSPVMNVSPTLPSTEGTVIYGKAPNENTSIALTVKHLPHPKKLTPPANNYVLWLRPKGAAAQNIGELTVDDNLTGTLNTVTAVKNFDLFITAEANGQVQQPTGPQLLWATHNG